MEILSRLVCFSVGFLYPTYVSYKCVRLNNVPAQQHMLKYWIVFAVFSTAEWFLDIFLSILPFYYFFKCGFVLYLALSESGTDFFYDTMIAPFLTRHEATLDAQLAQATTTLRDLVGSMTAKAFNFLQEKGAILLARGQQAVVEQLQRNAAGNPDAAALPANQGSADKTASLSTSPPTQLTPSRLDATPAAFTGIPAPSTTTGGRSNSGSLASLFAGVVGGNSAPAPGAAAAAGVPATYAPGSVSPGTSRGMTSFLAEMTAKKTS